MTTNNHGLAYRYGSSTNRRNIISTGPDIENSYVMGNDWALLYYCNCKLLFADFIEGDEKESLGIHTLHEKTGQKTIFSFQIV